MSECKLCGKQCDDLNHEIEHLVMQMIKNENPQWVESDGACKRCIQYYSDLDNIVAIED